MQGGGFRAFARDVGLTVGLLAAAAKAQAGGPPTFASSRLYERFGTLSTVSGSSWFVAELAYSQRFVSLLEGMAASPGAAGAAYGRGWMAKWIAASGHGRGTSELQQAVDGAGLNFLSQDLAGLAYFFDRHHTWHDVTATLLQTTAGVGSEVRLGSPVVAWAEGKTWLVCNSMVSGSPERAVTLSTSLGRSVHYAVRQGASSEPVPVYIPAKFSITFGAGTASSAPLPYVASGIASTDSIVYRGSGFFGLRQMEARSPQLGDFRAVTQDAGMLPVSSVVAASSAFLGGICLTRGFSAVADWLDSAFTPWVATAGPVAPGNGFREGNALVSDLRGSAVSHGRLEAVASAAVVGAVDAAFTDSTGIAHAVGAGASEVTAFLDLGADGTAPGCKNLFRGGQSSIMAAGVPQLFFQIFAESVEGMQEQFATFTHLVLPHTHRYLTHIATGTLKATTVENRWFGITGGRSVTIHVVSVTTNLAMGGLDDFNNYNGLVQEVVNTITSEQNAEAVQSLLTKV